MSSGLTSKRPKKKVSLDALPFFYLEAQRDVVEDLKFKSSYLGRMMSQISQSYSQDDIEALESIIEELNNKAIEKAIFYQLFKQCYLGLIRQLTIKAQT